MILGAGRSVGQVKGVLHGRLIDAANQVPVKHAKVINKRNHEITSSDNQGLFNMEIEYSDSLIISCDGFKNRYFTLSMNAERQSGIMYIFLQNDTIYFKPVTIRPPDLNKAMNTPVKDTLRLMGVKQYQGPPDEVRPSMMRPVTFLYEMFNKEAITRRKLNKARKIRRDKAYGGIRELDSLPGEKSNNLH